MSLSKNQKKVITSHGGNLSKVSRVSGGHMSYHHLMFDGPERSYFAKAHDPALFTDPDFEKDSEDQLKKEVKVYGHLLRNGFKHIPVFSFHDESMLLLEALKPEDGWHWRMPTNIDLQERYLNEILGVLKKLEDIPPFHNDATTPAMLATFQKDGWDNISPGEATELVESGFRKWADIMRPDTLQEAKRLGKVIASMERPKPLKRAKHFNHHDARQPNIAWHPEHGTTVVDWSRADFGVKNGDTTMFLIDLHKRGYKLPKGHAKFFNKDYALCMMGYWLKRSSAPPSDDNDTVRYHQFVSAVMAYSLVKKFDK